MRTAHDVREMSRELDLTDDELKRIHVLPEGERLQQGGTYMDLRYRGRDMAAGRENAYVAKDQVSYDTWNKLRGIDDPRRTT